MANPRNDQSLMADKSGDSLLGDRQANVPLTTDSLDGATLTGSTLTTSSTPTVTELEANDGVHGGKVNAILAILEAHGLMTEA